MNFKESVPSNFLDGYKNDIFVVVALTIMALRSVHFYRDWEECKRKLLFIHFQAIFCPLSSGICVFFLTEITSE